ncbi:hypothetical protein LC1Hm_1775 [Halomicrobium sp. LC1Hm]|nr:hypothetical protein LC1Hm_1775 [Halomicrobium sp. LC1Hm]
MRGHTAGRPSVTNLGRGSRVSRNGESRQYHGRQLGASTAIERGTGRPAFAR